MNEATKFYSVRHPGGSEPKSAVFRAAAASGSWKLPESWRGQMVMVCAEGVGLQYSITQLTQPITVDALSDPAVTPNPAAGFPLPADSAMDRAANGEWLNWAQKGTGTGTIAAYVSQELVKLGG
jgi:hypothetical protein